MVDIRLVQMYFVRCMANSVYITLSDIQSICMHYLNVTETILDQAGGPFGYHTVAKN